mmetsp:Transcript_83055/g.235299  ORF Transcript_83055/g.235299 Transcript_83055/m.235299 type:complete len:209 (-) Transcript_83055:201-827(-)
MSFHARPTAGWAASPQPAISPVGSTTTVERVLAVISAQARRSVVLPTPGGPRKSTESEPRTMSATSCALSRECRPTRMVRITTSPAAFLVAETRCSVPSMPARSWRLKEPLPIRASTCRTSALLTSEQPPRYWILSLASPGARQRTSGGRPMPSTTSTSPPVFFFMCRLTAFLMASGSIISMHSSSRAAASSRGSLPGRRSGLASSRT